ncbi:MAG: hypothetical protein RL769_777 [Pseudomonadota bacterium]|jgi:hypothetical protein
MNFFKKIPRFIQINIAISLLISSLSCLIIYKIIDYKIPKIAVVDLSYLNNEFVVNLSRHLLENKIDDKNVEEAVRTHLDTLESILNDISQSKNNFILLQKQTVISPNIEDITKQIEQVIFNNIVAKTSKKNIENEK